MCISRCHEPTSVRDRLRFKHSFPYLHKINPFSDIDLLAWGAFSRIVFVICIALVGNYHLIRGNLSDFLAFLHQQLDEQLWYYPQQSMDRSHFLCFLRTTRQEQACLDHETRVQSQSCQAPDHPGGTSGQTERYCRPSLTCLQRWGSEDAALEGCPRIWSVGRCWQWYYEILEHYRWRCGNSLLGRRWSLHSTWGLFGVSCPIPICKNQQIAEKVPSKQNL